MKNILREKIQSETIYTKEKIEEELNKPLLVINERSLGLLFFVNLPIDVLSILFVVFLISIIGNIIVSILLSFAIFIFLLGMVHNYLFNELIIYKDKVIITRFLIPDYIENIYRIREVREIPSPGLIYYPGIEFNTNNQFFKNPKKNNFISEIKNNKYCGQVIALSSEDREKIKETIYKITNMSRGTKW